MTQEKRRKILYRILAVVAAIAIVVSEETGRISVAIKGEFQLRLSAEQLESVLTKEMMPAT